MLYIGVDVGGTKVLAVEVDEAGEVRRTAQRAMPGRDVPEAVLEDVITQAVEAVADAGEVAAVGIAAAGLVDDAGEVVRFASHLPWRETPVRARLAQRWGTHVVLDNDAHCAAHAELTYGAARGAESALLIAVGTGIGGAVISGGEVKRGAGGMAGEFGHMQVVADGLECECGRRGCWEQYCSGTALERIARVSLGSHLDGRQVTALARAGDEVALSSFATVGSWLGVGTANLVSALDPALVVVGGGVSDVGDLLLDPARRVLASAVHGAGHRTLPPLVAAHFGSDAGAIGAACLARDAVNAASG